MKKLLAILLVLCFVFGGCEETKSPNLPKEDEPLSEADNFQSEEEPSGEKETFPFPTSSGKELGITYENYPKIDGSTSTFKIVLETFRYMFHGGAEGNLYNYEPGSASKTVPSYKMLINGEVDLIIVPYASKEVLDLAAEKGVELEFHKIAAEALIFITPKENTAENLTKEQIRDIYIDYSIKNWNRLGGPNRELIPLCRNADSGSQSQLDNLILEGEPMHPDIEKNFKETLMDGMLFLTAGYHKEWDKEVANQYALGYTLYTYFEHETSFYGIGDYLKILSYEGVAPTKENIANGKYPLTDGYYAVIRKDLPKEHRARAILDWLKSQKGQEIIERSGFIPTTVSGASPKPREEVVTEVKLSMDNVDYFFKLEEFPRWIYDKNGNPAGVEIVHALRIPEHILKNNIHPGHKLEIRFNIEYDIGTGKIERNFEELTYKITEKPTEVLHHYGEIGANITTDELIETNGILEILICSDGFDPRLDEEGKGEISEIYIPLNIKITDVEGSLWFYYE